MEYIRIARITRSNSQISLRTHQGPGENWEQLLVPLWLRTAFLQRELLEFLFSFSLKSVGSGSGGDRREGIRGGRSSPGKETQRAKDIEEL